MDGVATLEQRGPGLVALPLHVHLRLGGVQRHRGQLGPGLAAHRAARLALAAAALVAKVLAEAQLLLNLNRIYYNYKQMDEISWTYNI